MIKCYFGVPGCGKTTILVKKGLKELKRKIFKKYDNIYTINFKIKGIEQIEWEYLSKYKFKNALILIDEITMSADNREFKTFDKNIRDFFILHRHFGCDIIYATQNYENVDKKIRDLTASLWYVEKSIVPILKEFTHAKQIYRNININEYTSELTLGYRFCSFLEMIFGKNSEFVLRRLYYKKFNSWDEGKLKERELYEKSKHNSNINNIINNT